MMCLSTIYMTAVHLNVLSIHFTIFLMALLLHLPTFTLEALLTVSQSMASVLPWSLFVPIILPLFKSRSHTHCMFPTYLAISSLHSGLLQPYKNNIKSLPFTSFPHGCLLLINHHVIPLQYHPTSNLPVFQLIPSQPLVVTLANVPNSPNTMNHFDPLCGFNAHITPLLPTPDFQQMPDQYANLITNQWQLYDWHVCLGHMNFASIQSMARKDMGIPHALASCQPPLCQECQYIKAKWWSMWSTSYRRMTITSWQNVLCWPNDCRMCWSTIYHARRGHHSQHHFTVCTFFVDVATHHIFPHFQETTNTMETLTGKQCYEQYCQHYHWTMQECRSNNGIFTDRQFTETLPKWVNIKPSLAQAPTTWMVSQSIVLAPYPHGC